MIKEMIILGIHHINQDACFLFFDEKELTNQTNVLICKRGLNYDFRESRG